ncbi:DUF397 domain-containing protein [Fodinicola acaciae]|uniref:DUF397 domain-containing protein n=1 Tax=Fodinicola acaciae TaxID=2681555 RepID=UPI0013D88A9E|nr:DUF397 domain-containing protein [Fodinicola acaciae]
MNDLSGATWRKSTRSNGGGGNCVEVSDYLTGHLLVRDSKLRDQSPILTVSPTSWGAFVIGVQADRFAVDEH